MPFGAGFSPAGLGPAGHDPTIDPSRAPTVPAPLDVRLFHALGAMKIDLSARDAVLDTDGTYEHVHPVDQRVALALGPAVRALKSVPNTGQTLGSLRRAGESRLAASVTSAVTFALSSLISAGEIALLSVEVTKAPRGPLSIVVRYRNLRDGGAYRALSLGA